MGVKGMWKEEYVDVPFKSMDSGAGWDVISVINIVFFKTVRNP